ncbi:MAG: hypothetical protein P8R02_17375 [Pseudomonadales bacterium]|jgi:hypothetical protein|nr:hypothetical protein [Pseudomonadales bacterium]
MRNPKRIDAANPKLPGPPSTTPHYIRESQGMDWRISLGMFCSVVWIVVLMAYLSGAVGWTNMANLPIEKLGGFLEGSFAPLAFLWFVLGYFSQQKELRQNTEAIKMQYVEIQKSADQATIQAEATQDTAFHARQESFLRTYEIVKEQLGAIIGFLYISSQGSIGAGIVPTDRISVLWGTMSTDPEIFSRQMLELSFLHGPTYGYKLMFGTEIRKRHADNFMGNFERLLEAARDSDTNGMIEDAVRGSGHGHLYERMLDFKTSPPPGFTLGVYDYDPDSFE